MIHGLKKWTDKDTYFIQTNNPTEEILRKEDGKGFLESCGPTTAVNLMAARGDIVNITCPGIYHPQPEEVLTDYFNDPINYPIFEKVRKDLNIKDFMNNRIPQLYPIALLHVFNVKALFEWENLRRMVWLLDHNIGLMVCLKNPGHYIGIVAYNGFTKELCYREPWSNNPWPAELYGQSGFNRWINEERLLKNLTNYRVLIGR